MNAEILKMKKELRIWLSIHYWWMMAVESAVFLLHLSVKSEPFLNWYPFFSNTIQVAQNFLSHIYNRITISKHKIAILSLGLTIFELHDLFSDLKLETWTLGKESGQDKNWHLCVILEKKTGPPLGYVYHFHIYLFIFQLRVSFLKSVSFKRKLFISTKKCKYKNCVHCQIFDP